MHVCSESSTALRTHGTRGYRFIARVPPLKDPFVLKHRPSVYFAGNCNKFETRLVDGNGDDIAEDNNAVHRGSVTRLVCVPSFAMTSKVVLIKLQSLEYDIVSFYYASIMMD